jgi:hypothetical protein
MHPVAASSEAHLTGPVAISTIRGFISMTDASTISAMPVAASAETIPVSGMHSLLTFQKSHSSSSAEALETELSGTVSWTAFIQNTTVNSLANPVGRKHLTDTAIWGTLLLTFVKHFEWSPSVRIAHSTDPARRPISSNIRSVEEIAKQVSASILNKKDIMQYLTDFPDVAPIIGSLLGAARHEFGRNAELLLELYRDPDINDKYLKVCIRVPKYDETVRRRLEVISRSHEDLLSSASGYVTITTDYRPPSDHASI